MWIFPVMVILLVSALVCVYKKRNTECKWFIIAALALYCINYAKAWIVTYFPEISGFFTNSLLFASALLLILLIAAVICIFRRKYSVCKWIILAALIVYLLTNRNILYGLLSIF